MTTSTEPTLKIDPRVENVWSELATSDTLAFSETIVPQSLLDARTHQGSTRTDPAQELALRDTIIGKGGMGLVRLADQRSLRREVAVKSVRVDCEDPDAVESLVREGRVTGRLEHPNIIPIHDLRRDSRDQPMLVMKRVDGVSWADTLDDPARIPPRFRAGRDHLEAHLQVLLEVCDALHFAHSKGIIHRDLKPDNVMLGEFGEVYLLDWGIAVSMNHDDDGVLPVVSEIDAIAGTPHYMSPEQTTALPDHIGPRTDVYLLGAVLHEVLTGEPRHKAPTLYGMFVQAYRSAPVEYPPEVPEELAAICNRATAADPELRFESADAFRLAVVDYLRHRDSHRITDNAAHRLQELKTADDGDVYRLFAQCRFGFDQALDIWPGNARARRGKEEAITTMADFELRQEDEKAAALLIDELENPPSELLRRLKDLRDRLDARDHQVERLERIQHAVDINLATRERAKMAAILGLLWGMVPAGHAALVRTGLVALDYTSYFIQFLGPTTVALAVIYAMRRRIIANAITSRLILAIFVNMGANLLVRVTMWAAGAPVTTSIAIENAIAGFCVALIATLVDRRLWPPSLIFAAAALAVGFFPGLALEISTLANTFGLWAIALIWWVRSPLYQDAGVPENDEI